MRRYLLALIVLLLLAGCSAGRGCRPDVPPPTPTIPPPPTIAPTMTPTAENPATATRTPIAPSVTPESATATATATIEATVTATPQATPVLLGHHAVVRGDTMWDIAGKWYGGPGCYEYCGHLKWQIICDANGQIDDCRMIYVNDVLAIPALP